MIEMNNTQNNGKWRWCGDIDEVVNYISECSKQAQKEYKGRHDWVGKVIHQELSKRLKFDHVDEWDVHKTKISSQKGGT